MNRTMIAGVLLACLAAPASAFQDVTAAPPIEMPPADVVALAELRDDYAPAAGSDRLNYAVSKTQRGTSVPIPSADVARLCGDRDGCSVRIGMHNWDDTGRVASREFLLFYNPANRVWRASLGDTAGTDSNNVVEHVNNSWSCYMTDGEYVNWNHTESRAGFGLLSWNQYNADCWLTIID